ncbi:hypothetical protein BH10PLA2_BH10PLA2_06620 [soil metagenome]
MKYMPRKGYSLLALVVVASMVWGEDSFAQPTPQNPSGAGTSQPPAAGQTGSQPGSAQIAPRTLPNNLQNNQTTPQRPSEADVAAASNTATPLTGGNQTSNPNDVRMLGDQGPLGVPAVAFGPRFNIPGVPPVPPIPGTQGPLSRGAVLAPSQRGIKVADNQSPMPQDRLYFNFNYFDNLNRAANERLGIDVHDVNAYSYTFGVEKTFLDGDASVGLRVPINSLSTVSGSAGFDGTWTDIGNLTVILKYLVFKDEQGDALSAGLAVTAPTGPNSFAGASQFATPNPTVIQPFMGYRVILGQDLFLQGFFAGDFPTDQSDVTMFFSDVGLGYFLLRRGQDSPNILTAIVPTFEVHVNNPLNHRGAFNGYDVVGTADVVNLTTGVTFEINHRSTFTVGIVTPVTGPKPFDIEALAQVNWSFGYTARRGQPVINNLN